MGFNIRKVDYDSADVVNPPGVDTAGLPTQDYRPPKKTQSRAAFLWFQLALGLGLAVGVVFLLGRLGDWVGAVSAEGQGLDWWLVTAVKLALALALMVAPLAAVGWLVLKALAAGVTQLQNGQPVATWDVVSGWGRPRARRMATWGLGQFHHERGIWAANSQVRAMTTYAPTATSHYDPRVNMSGVDHPALLTGPGPALAGQRLDLLAQMGPATGASNLLLGVNETGQEVRGDVHSIMHTGFLGGTGNGKTTAEAGLALQLACDPTVALGVADPHLQELTLLEYTGALWRPIPKPGAVVDFLLDVVDELDQRITLFERARLAYTQARQKPCVVNNLATYNRLAERLTAAGLEALGQVQTLVVFADELKALASDQDAVEALRRITGEGRKYGIYLVGASQNWNVNTGLVADIRQQFWTRVALAGSPVVGVANLFEVPNKEATSIVTQLTAPGVAAFWRLGKGITFLRFPFLDLTDEAKLADALALVHARRHATVVEAVLGGPAATGGGPAATGGGPGLGGSLGGGSHSSPTNGDLFADSQGTSSPGSSGSLAPVTLADLAHLADQSGVQIASRTDLVEFLVHLGLSTNHIDQLVSGKRSAILADARAVKKVSE